MTACPAGARSRGLTALSADFQRAGGAVHALEHGRMQVFSV
jgi:hypothetical protein